MPKITFMGAGSTVFARNVLGDCMCTPALRNSEIALYDIDSKRLEESEIILGAINKNTNEGRANIKTYLGVENRKEALRGADFVVNAIQIGGYDPCTITDFEIPKKYGLRQTIGDTLGIGGIMRALRTIPVLQDFADEMNEVCPNAWFLNYTNPMAMLSGYMQRYTWAGFWKFMIRTATTFTRKSENGLLKRILRKSMRIWSAMNISAVWAITARNPASTTRSIIPGSSKAAARI